MREGANFRKDGKKRKGREGKRGEGSWARENEIAK